MRVGVLGTMVWDRIHARDVRVEPIEEWGGIGYALGAFRAAAPEDWEVVPIVRLGSDLAERAASFLASIPGLDLTTGLCVVPEPNNRVELRYTDATRRSERLTGGVSPWSWPEIEPLLDDLDALYVNFISGMEMELETMQRIRMKMRRPIYGDLHSLLLGITPAGLRVPRPLERWRDWLACFDIVQVNEDELGRLAHAWGDPWQFAADVVGEMPRLLFVTLGPRGAAYVASPLYRREPSSWWSDARGLALRRGLTVSGPARSERVPSQQQVEDPDATGCGDVWGATAFARLLAGDDLDEAMSRANGAGSRNARHRGAAGLYHYLQGRIPT